MKKYLAELVGTFVLTFLGCGAAVALGCGQDTASIVGTAIAFGLAVVAMAYTIGGISGCHINPAITLGVFLNGGISAKDCGMYMVFQVIGAILAAAVLVTGGMHIERRRNRVAEQSRANTYVEETMESPMPTEGLVEVTP